MNDKTTLQELQTQNELLYNETVRLQNELDFMNELFEHSTAMVFQLKRFTIRNRPVWINTQTATRGQLLELDSCKEVDTLLQNLDVKYSERC